MNGDIFLIVTALVFLVLLGLNLILTAAALAAIAQCREMLAQMQGDDEEEDGENAAESRS